MCESVLYACVYMGGVSCVYMRGLGVICMWWGVCERVCYMRGVCAMRRVCVCVCVCYMGVWVLWRVCGCVCERERVWFVLCVCV